RGMWMRLARVLELDAAAEFHMFRENRPAVPKADRHAASRQPVTFSKQRNVVRELSIEIERHDRRTSHWFLPDAGPFLDERNPGVTLQEAQKCSGLPGFDEQHLCREAAGLVRVVA